jgi:hypothetical protein
MPKSRIHWRWDSTAESQFHSNAGFKRRFTATGAQDLHISRFLQYLCGFSALLLHEAAFLLSMSTERRAWAVLRRDGSDSSGLDSLLQGQIMRLILRISIE